MGTDNIGRVEVDGDPCFSVLDTGATVNLITPGYCEERQLKIYPLTDLLRPGESSMRGIGEARFDVVGYTVINIQIKGIRGYNEDVVALVLKHDTDFAVRVPLLLGTSTLDRVVNVIKESELDVLAIPWEKARVASLMRARRIIIRRAVARRAQGRSSGKTIYQQAVEMVNDSGYSTDPSDDELRDMQIDPNEYEDIVRAQAEVTLAPFARTIIRGRVNAAVLQGRLHTVTSEMLPEEGKLPPGVRFWSTYSSLKKGSKKVSVLLENTTAVAVTLSKGTPLARVSAGNVVPEKYVLPGVIGKLEKDLGLEPKQTDSEITEEERKDRIMEKLDLSGLDSWPPLLAAKARALIREFADIFALGTHELGRTEVVQHEIVVDNETPIKERFRRIPPHMVEEVREHLKVMLEAGAIAPSDSPWSNAVVLVRKKDGSLRFCIDFRRLNDRTRKDSYPLPRIQETLDSLVGARHFSCVDFLSGFWQIPMSPDSRKYTAFTVGNLGFFECQRMPFGLCNAPATFQRCMQNVLGELNLTFCLIYLDDVIIYSETEEDHLVRLRAVFERIRTHGLRLKPSKCKFFQKEITYLAHHISGDGIRPSGDNVAVIKAVKEPTTYTEIRSFTNLAGHYRRFIPKFSSKARPLTDYLSGEGANKKKETLVLSPQAKAAFELLQNALTEEPVLQLARFDRPFMLHTDASKIGLGAELEQQDDQGVWHPVAYGSRTLTTHEKNYHSSKLEFLALLWAVTKQFKDYLLHVPFVVKTDNNPLTYVMTTPNLDATGHRWVGALASFNFSLEYVKGKHNVAADVLSRLEESSLHNPRELEERGPESGPEEGKTAKGSPPTRINAEEVKAILDGALLGSAERAEAFNQALARRVEEDHLHGERAWKAVANDPIVDREGPEVPTEEGDEPKVYMAKYMPIERVDWTEAQKEDPTLRKARDWVLGGKKGPLAKALGEDATTFEGQGYVRQRDNLVYLNGCLYVKQQGPNDVDPTTLFIVPKDFRQQAIDGCHRNAGHQGQDRTLSLLRERFWWPGMINKVRSSVKGCHRCIKFEAKGVKVPLNPITATAPMELLHVDFTSIERPVALNQQTSSVNVLVFTDHFTRYALAFTTKDQTSRTVAEILYKDVIVPFGAPAKLLSDKGTCFTSTIVSELCRLLGVQRCRTSAYHAQTNGQVERMHQTIMRMLGKLQGAAKLDWGNHLPEVVQAYNATRGEVTGYSPFFLMFGRRPRLPLDFFFPTIRGDTRPRRVPEYVASILEHLKLAFEAAREAQAYESGRQKRLYDKNTGAAQLKPGDVVLLRTDAFVGKRKIKDKWGDTPYTVEGQVADDIPVYKIRSDTGSMKTVHRNRLLYICATELEGNEFLMGPVPPNGGVHVRSTSLLATNPEVTDPREDEKEKPQEKHGWALVPKLSRHALQGWIFGQYRGVPWMTVEASRATKEPVSPDPALGEGGNDLPIGDPEEMDEREVD